MSYFLYMSHLILNNLQCTSIINVMSSAPVKLTTVGYVKRYALTHFDDQRTQIFVLVCFQSSKQVSSSQKGFIYAISWKQCFFIFYFRQSVFIRAKYYRQRNTEKIASCLQKTRAATCKMKFFHQQSNSKNINAKHTNKYNTIENVFGLIRHIKT